MSLFYTPWNVRKAVALSCFERVWRVKLVTGKKCPYSELFWSAFSRIRTEYGVLGIRTLFTQWVKANNFLENFKRPSKDFHKILLKKHPRLSSFLFLKTQESQLLQLKGVFIEEFLLLTFSPTIHNNNSSEHNAILILWIKTYLYYIL